MWSLPVSERIRSNVSREQSRCYNDLQGLTSPNPATAFDIRPHIGLKAKHLAHRRAHSGCDPEGGVRAVPAGGLANRSRAASGIMSAGITAGARGAAAGLGQERAGNARELPRPRKPGLKSKSREASAPEADGFDRPWRAPRPKRGRVATSVRVVRPIRFAPSGAPPPFILFGGEHQWLSFLPQNSGANGAARTGSLAPSAPRYRGAARLDMR
jgi:hypothetical protein